MRAHIIPGRSFWGQIVAALNRQQGPLNITLKLQYPRQSEMVAPSTIEKVHRALRCSLGAIERASMALNKRGQQTIIGATYFSGLRRPAVCERERPNNQASKPPHCHAMFQNYAIAESVSPL